MVWRGYGSLKVIEKPEEVPSRRARLSGRRRTCTGRVSCGLDECVVDWMSVRWTGGVSGGMDECLVDWTSVRWTGRLSGGLDECLVVVATATRARMTSRHDDHQDDDDYDRA